MSYIQTDWFADFHQDSHQKPLTATSWSTASGTCGEMKNKGPGDCWYPFIKVDHALGWGAEYKQGLAAFCVAVMSAHWEADWWRHVNQFARTGHV